MAEEYNALRAASERMRAALAVGDEVTLVSEQMVDKLKAERGTLSLKNPGAGK